MLLWPHVHHVPLILCHIRILYYAFFLLPFSVTNVCLEDVAVARKWIWKIRGINNNKNGRNKKETLKFVYDYGKSRNYNKSTTEPKNYNLFIKNRFSCRSHTNSQNFSSVVLPLYMRRFSLILFLTKQNFFFFFYSLFSFLKYQRMCVWYYSYLTDMAWKYERNRQIANTECKKNETKQENESMLGKCSYFTMRANTHSWFELKKPLKYTIQPKVHKTTFFTIFLFNLENLSVCVYEPNRRNGKKKNQNEIVTEILVKNKKTQKKFY